MFISESARPGLDEQNIPLADFFAKRTKPSTPFFKWSEIFGFSYFPAILYSSAKIVNYFGQTSLCPLFKTAD